MGLFFTLALVVITLKLLGYMTISWWIVLLPIVILIPVPIILLTILVVSALGAIIHDITSSLKFGKENDNHN